MEQPDWKEEHFRLDPIGPVMRKQGFQQGVTKPPYTASWDHPAWRQEYMRQGEPVTETKRAWAMNKTYWATKDKKLYPFSNAMTSTQYKKPVTSVYGPMLREKPYGLNYQHNKHGFMPCHDYYF